MPSALAILLSTEPGADSVAWSYRFCATASASPKTSSRAIVPLQLPNYIGRRGEPEYIRQIVRHRTGRARIAKQAGPPGRHRNHDVRQPHALGIDVSEVVPPDAPTIMRE